MVTTLGPIRQSLSRRLPPPLTDVSRAVVLTRPDGNRSDRTPIKIGLMYAEDERFGPTSKRSGSDLGE
jgi:hypothetical protein